MKRGLYMPPFGTLGDVNFLVELAQTAEAAGWDGFFLWDHIRFEEPVPLADAWVALSAIAATTERITLGPLITPLPRRRPQKVAREAVTLDHLSNGRLVLGVGLGIDWWGEFSVFNEPATDDAKRAKLLDEGIDQILRLWSGEFLPPPLQQPRIPIWSAVIWPPAREGPIRRAARLDGVVPFKPESMTPDDVRAVREKVGRDDPRYDVCVVGQPERAAEFEAAGATWFLEGFWHEGSPADIRRIVAAGP
jgi:alkanesulfonate monooxygenase SsuD/methylene tetrahydromethanopterin reductase-like flavin-dependent oxidoreductase (luciferase family)